MHLHLPPYPPVSAGRALAVVLLLVTALAFACSSAALAGPREYREFIGGDYAFGGKLTGLSAVPGGGNALQLSPDPSDPTRYVTSGVWESGARTLGVGATKWLTSISASASVPPSTTIGVEYSIDGKAYTRSAIPTAGIAANSVRFRVTLTSTQPTATPVLGGVTVGFYLEKPTTPPKAGGGKKSGNSSGGTGGSGGTGAGSTWSGSGTGGYSAGSSTGGITSGTGSGYSVGTTDSVSGISPGAGQPAEMGTGLVQSGIQPDPTVRGMVLSESEDAGGTDKETAQNAAETRTARNVAVGIPGLALIYSAGLAWPGMRSGTLLVRPRRMFGWLGRRLASFGARFKTEG